MDTFLNLKHWFNEVKTQSEEHALVFLVANKKDREQDREVSTEKGEQFARENGIDLFFETSAKSGDNVEETFITSAKMLLRKHYRKIREEQLKMMQPKSKKLRKG